jgi:hypothetical protein
VRSFISLRVTEVIHAYGHENILSTHRTTLEITKELHLTREGDCIIAVSADKATNELGSQFKQSLRRCDAKFAILIEAGGAADSVNAFGNPALVMTHPTDLVVRKSSHICNRTLAIKADKAAWDLSRKLVGKLRNPKQEVKITLSVEV